MSNLKRPSWSILVDSFTVHVALRDHGSHPVDEVAHPESNESRFLRWVHTEKWDEYGHNMETDIGAHETPTGPLDGK